MRKRIRPCVMRYHKVSKLEDSEKYYLTILQLYMPWKTDIDLKGNFDTYEEKFNTVKKDIMANISKHDINFEKNLDNDLNTFLDRPVSDTDNSDTESEKDDENEYNMIHPDIIDVNVDDYTNDIRQVPSSSINDLSMPITTYYDLCSKLNEKQLELFYFIFKHAIQTKLADINGLEIPSPFKIFLSGGAGVGKSFLVKLITETLKRTLKEPTQNFADQPSVIVTASTGKAAANIEGTTVHTAFKLPLYGKCSSTIKKLSDKQISDLQIKFKFLKVLLIDEVSMVGQKTFENLNIELQKINRKNQSFGGVSVLLIGDFFQLVPVSQQSIYSPKDLDFTWEEFLLHELTEIVRQSGDPEFAALLNRLREGNHTKQDIEVIKSFEHTDTSDWPKTYMKMFITNYLVDLENDKCLKQLPNYSGRKTSIAKDDITGKINIPNFENLKHNETAGLPKSLTVCIGAKVMLTRNLDIEDKLVNGSMGTIVHIQGLKKNKPNGTIWIEFDNSSTGNNIKSLRNEKKDWVPITPIKQSFQFNNVNITRQQFPLVIQFASTIHKGQGSTLPYFEGDLDQTTEKGKGKATVGPGMLYTLLSRGTSSKTIKLSNFLEKHIRVNENAKIAMTIMRKERQLNFLHPLKKLQEHKICLYNIRSWNLHIEHFLSDRELSTNCILFFFTETNGNSDSFPRSIISDYENMSKWNTIHKNTKHGLSVSFNNSVVNQVTELQTTNQCLEVLPTLIKIENKKYLFILIYRPPSSQYEAFRNLLESELNFIYKNITENIDQTIIFGDFNMPENEISCTINKFDHFHQRSQYSTHIDGNKLDLIFDNKIADPVEWLPSPYSDHFILLMNIICEK